MATSGVYPPAYDSNSSSKLVYFLRWSTKTSRISIISCSVPIWLEGRGLEVVLGDSIGSGQSKTSKSSLKSTTSMILTVSSSRAEPGEVALSSTMCWTGSTAWWLPSWGRLVRNPCTATLICFSKGSFALMTFFRDWKLDEIGLYPRIMWAARNCLFVFRKISDWRILVRSAPLTKLKLGAVWFLSTEIKKQKND